MWKKVIQFLVPVLLAISLVFVVVEFWNAIKWMFLHLKLYMWFFIGVSAYLVLRLIPLLRKNEEWLQVFSHELTHTIV